MASDELHEELAAILGDDNEPEDPGRGLRAQRAIERDAVVSELVELRDKICRACKEADPESERGPRQAIVMGEVAAHGHNRYGAGFYMQCQAPVALHDRIAQLTKEGS